MDYLRWSKLHKPVTYELTASGVPPVTIEELQSAGVAPPQVKLKINGTYGDLEFIDAVAHRYNVEPARVIPVPGASSANFIALATCAARGQRILVERPLYQPIQRVGEFLGLEFVRLDRDPNNGFAISLEMLEAQLARGARAVVLTNLHNPSGQYISPEFMSEIANVCARADATLIVDEVYLDAAYLSSGADRWTVANLQDRAIATNSLTKIYGLGGTRGGWVIAPSNMVSRAHELVDLLHADFPAPTAAVANWAMTNIDWLEDRFRNLRETGLAIFDRWIARESRMSTYPNRGAIFQCVRLPVEVSSDAMNETLVSQYDTQVVPGSFFGIDDHIRLSIAPADVDLEEALDRISRALDKLL